jgi:hypothetical protein
MTWELSPNGRVLVGFRVAAADDLFAAAARKLGFKWTQDSKCEVIVFDPATAHEARSKRWTVGMGFSSGMEVKHEEIAQLTWSSDGTTLVNVDRSARVATLWDIPPRKSLAWFAAGAALLALRSLSSLDGGFAS